VEYALDIVFSGNPEMNYRGLAVAFVLLASALNINVKPASACGDSKATISHEKVAIITATHMPVRCSWSWDDKSDNVINVKIVKNFEEGQKFFQNTFKKHSKEDSFKSYDLNNDRYIDAITFYDSKKGEYILMRVFDPKKQQRIDPSKDFQT
jgi:hypothetical protein